MNEYDSQKTVEILQNKKDMEVTTNVDEADIILLNTCSIREKAEDKVYSELGRLNKLKIKNPNIKIGVGGCVATQEGSNITKRAPYVDLIYGPQTLHKVSDLLDEDNKLKAIDITFPIEEKFDSLPEPTATSPSSFVAIMEGCSKYCSFCVVPYTRGDEVSRKAQQIFDEIARLVEQGTSEIVFVGQNVNSYKQVHEGRTLRLSDLIDIASNINGVERIRFTTSHPLDMTDDLIEIFGSVPQLANQLHLPVQSGSDRVLKAMKRNYTADLYRDIIERVKKIRPTIKVTSDFIVGFPGETHSEFLETMQLIEDIQFDSSFSFIYSPRPGTPASILQDDVSKHEKKERLNILQARLNEIQRGFGQKMVGSIQRCLVTGISKKRLDQLQARTECNRVINFPFQNIGFIGKLVDIKVEEALAYSLLGTLHNTKELV
jgi:tRNA-2-methylthio-N6-dimethylallyladenosine synthase|tara:strand:+ start:128 stop:1423 length:1296 start_codon:yes stop_codon:yes gene_type:complete